MNDDLNTPEVIAILFDMVRLVNRMKTGEETLTEKDLKQFSTLFQTYTFDILGLMPTSEGEGEDRREKSFSGAVDLLLTIRQHSKEQKDWATSDLIRDKMAELGFVVKDTKEGAEWHLNN